MSITLIAAVSPAGVIGAGGGMPWRLPEDLRRFRSLTMGRPMVMGRRTFESIGRPLPGRRSIVVTRRPDWTAAGVEVAGSVDEALRMAGADSGAEVMVVGGGEIYAQTIDLADRLEITRVAAEAAGDTYFPAIDPGRWSVADSEPHEGFSFVSYRRRPVAGTDLGALLTGLDAELHDGEYVFCCVPEPSAGGPAVATVREAEGWTVVLERTDAAGAGLDVSEPHAWITLRVRSALNAVGLTAAVSSALARDGIAANMLAGYHHDHLFVPADRAKDAMACLAALAHVRG